MKKLTLVFLIVLLAGAVLSPAGLAHEGALDICGGHKSVDGLYEVHDQVKYDACKADGNIGDDGAPKGRSKGSLPGYSDPAPPTNLGNSSREINPTEVQAGVEFVENNKPANEPAIQVCVDGQVVTFDVPPTLVVGRTLVPLRAIFESLGAEVTWEQWSQTAFAAWHSGAMSLQIGADNATVNGQAKKLDVPGQLIAGRTMVPLRFVAEAMGAQVGWYGNSKTITINKPVAELIAGTVTKVVDGDTIEVTLASGTVEKVRLIGVDTPETVHSTKGIQPYGPEASAFTKERLAGQTVQLETDLEQRDRYGRLLAYVYLSNGTMFNAVLVDEGYAQLMTYPPNVRYVEVFRALQTAAREANRGLWGQNSTPAVPADDDVSATAPPRYITPAYNLPSSEPKLTTICNDFDPNPAKHCNKPDPNSPPPVQVTPEPYTGPLPFDPKGPDRDCADFKPYGWRVAQAFYQAAGGPAMDPHDLDRDRDGSACDTLR